ncbi:MAG TPA: ATP-binding protein [Steroidobacteraceae bacterium]|nr:ATP-binding protein [Steroidobacteraceae bacterium]
MNPAIAESLLQQAPDALILTDDKGEIVFANAAVTTLFGYQPEELAGRIMEVLMPARYRRAHLTHRHDYVAQPVQRAMGQRGVPLFGLHRDGHEFPIWVSLSPIHTTDKLYIAAAVRDMSDWHALTEQLREASEVAKAAAHTKSRFLATASHDLRQPLQALQLLNASLHAGLERKLSKSDLLAIADRQHHAIEAMTELLNALLDISKLESGTVQVKNEHINMPELIAELREQFGSVASAKQLALNTDIADINVHTDRVLLRQLVQNLIGNAIKYTDAGSVDVKVLTDSNGATIEIADTGVGIPRDQVAKIFDAYYQTPGHRPDRPGVGLGLAIVKQIAELLGYAIAVESQPGRGTTFRISIPRGAISQPTHVVDSSSQSTSAVSIPQGYILVIEDDRAVREALCLSLELEGFMVLSASSQQSAITTFTEHAAQIAAIVSDYHVDANHTGIEIVKTLRAISTSRLPAVFLTGDTSLALRAQQDVADSRLLSKPVQVARLTHALSELLIAQPLNS